MVQHQSIPSNRVKFDFPNVEIGCGQFHMAWPVLTPDNACNEDQFTSQIGILRLNMGLGHAGLLPILIPLSPRTWFTTNQHQVAG